MQAINRVLRQGVRPSSSSRSTIPIVLPDWCEKGTSLVYISKSNGQAHTVTVEKIEERQQMVVIRFDSNRKVWKRVPFVEVRKFGDGTLRPLWKKTEVSTVPERPKNYVDVDDSDEVPSAKSSVVDAEPSPEVVASPNEVLEPSKKRPAETTLAEEKKESKPKKRK
ncbi:unnamed protein product [Cladocopium goreaui]|uniref:EF-hand domain-containing protein n=1 Tax=Cladocopium goreaui TaxID=2562237 RepID=A0A9P1FRY4_9DINO|nr:unnamed protein product [Cladocopium goreaui]|mmetsp:Transcript_20139/g.44439  ORF Transcript_20139/g.44439 Transcript_20139/m.44439 type:complete len:166 (+) Transcript_20139:76-573(+)